MQKIDKPDGTMVVLCNYCSEKFKWSKFGGYNIYRRHVNNRHPTKAARSRSRAQIQIAKYAFPNTQLFRYSDANNREELVFMVAIEFYLLILVRKLILLIIVNEH